MPVSRNTRNGKPRHTRMHIKLPGAPRIKKAMPFLPNVAGWRYEKGKRVRRTTEQDWWRAAEQ